MEIRKINGYEIVQSFSIGQYEFVIGDNLNAPKGERFLIANVSNNGIFEKYDKCLVSDDYLEIVKEFSKRLSQQADLVRNENSKIPFVKTAITKENCSYIEMDKSVVNKVVVIDAEVFKPEYQDITRQLQLCIGGFGAESNSRGSACFCINLYTGKEARFERRDIIGVIDKDKLPQWAKDGLIKAEQQEINNRRVGRDAR